MKTIWGKGGANERGDLWIAIVPDDATSCTDPRRCKVVARHELNKADQAIWLDGYSFGYLDRVGEEHEAQADKSERILTIEGRSVRFYNTAATEGGSR